MIYLEIKVLTHLAQKAQIILLLVGKIIVLAKIFGLYQYFFKKLAVYLNRLILINVLLT